MLASHGAHARCIPTFRWTCSDGLGANACHIHPLMPTDDWCLQAIYYYWDEHSCWTCPRYPRRLRRACHRSVRLPAPPCPSCLNVPDCTGCPPSPLSLARFGASQNQRRNSTAKHLGHLTIAQHASASNSGPQRCPPAAESCRGVTQCDQIGPSPPAILDAPIANDDGTWPNEPICQ